MLRKHSNIIVWAHRILDIGLTILAYVVSYFMKKYLLPVPYQGLIPDVNYQAVLFLIIIIWYLSFSFFRLYESYRKQTYGQIFWKMFKAVFTSMLILTLSTYVLKITDISRIMMGLFFFFNIGLLGLSKLIVYKLLNKYRKKGYNFRNILIVGSYEGAKDLISAIGDRLEAGFRVLGCLEIDNEKLGTKVQNGISVIGTLESLEMILRKEVVDELIFSMPLKKIQNVEKYIDLAEEFGVTVRILPQWHIQQINYKPRISSIRFEEFLGIYTMALTTVPNEQSKIFFKYMIDYLLAVTMVILFFPILLIICILIKLFSKGPILFRQERVGCNGRKFILYKFRTMVVGAEKIKDELEIRNEVEGPVFKIKDDPRIIPYVGKFLRKTGLDELPQLINVLKGEMSIVGPRPPIPAEVEKYDVWQRRRLSMKPGLTCLWQCNSKRNDVCFNDWMNLDLEYIDNWCLKIDFKILLKTAWVVLRGTGR